MGNAEQEKFLLASFAEKRAVNLFRSRSLDCRLPSPDNSGIVLEFPQLGAFIYLLELLASMMSSRKSYYSGFVCRPPT
jgi:hypothetical protein